MAQCPRCGRKGLFLKLTDYNLCKNCTIETQRQPSAQTSAHSSSSLSSSVPTRKSILSSADDWQIKLQNITCHMNESRLVISESQLKASVKMYLEGHLKIVQDCVAIVNSTKKPDIFYSRMDLLLEKFDELCEVERIRPQLFTKSAIQNANDIRSKQSTAEANMIRRAWSSTVEEASKAKSDRGRTNKYAAFFEMMNDYQDRLAHENKELLQQLSTEVGLTSVYSSKVNNEPYNCDALIALQDEYSSLFRQHDKLTEQIGTAYAIANELKTPDSPEMDHVITLCKDDIALAPKYLEFWKRYDQLTEKDGSQIPKHYPTFSRLAIIYEKRKEYQAALDVCAQAVALGFTSDRTDGGMIGRAARLTRKLNQENSKNTRLATPEPATVISDTSEATNGIVTTATELEYFAVVKTLLHEVIDVNRISYKDTQSYLSILVDGKSTKWVCRLRVEGKNKSISIADENGKEIRYPLMSSNDLLNYKDALRERVLKITQ